MRILPEIKKKCYACFKERNSFCKVLLHTLKNSVLCAKSFYKCCLHGFSLIIHTEHIEYTLCLKNYCICQTVVEMQSLHVQKSAAALFAKALALVCLLFISIIHVSVVTVNLSMYDLGELLGQNHGEQIGCQKPLLQRGQKQQSSYVFSYLE